MRTTLAIAAATAVFLPAGLTASEAPVPERLVLAQYVALGIDLGDRIVAAEDLIGGAWNATPREREALEEIRQRLEGWDQYVVVNRASQAELLIVIREGRRASFGLGAGGPGGAGPTQGLQPGIGGTWSSPDDMLAVYDVGGGPSTPLWRMLQSDGLAGELPLFEAFRADVERAAERRKQR